MRILNSFRVRLTPLVLLLLASAWGARVLHSLARDRLEHAFESREYPVLFHGARLPLSESTDVLERFDADGRPIQRHLLIVLERNCPFCKRNISQWVSLLSDSAWPRDTDIWFLSMGPSLGAFDTLTRLAKHRHLPYRVIHPRDPAAFPVYTGILATPTTILLDDQNSIGVIATGILQEADLTLLAKALHGSMPLNSSVDSTQKGGK